MTATSSAYQALSAATLPVRLGTLAALCGRVGPADGWQVREVGDGNLNLVFIVTGAAGTVVVKQALPYVRLVGESWPLPLYRAFYEHAALTRQAARDPGSVPAIHHVDADQALIVMDYLSPHTILRRKLIAGERVAGLGAFLGTWCARQAFRGSELSMASADKKADVGLFSGNVAIPAITEGLVFTDPYYHAPRNSHTSGLEQVIATLRGDAALKARAQDMLMAFASNAETLLHGDLHSGSVMSTDTDSRVIDPEFAQYGPIGFDIGMLTANFLMAYLSQPGHRDDPGEYQDWILSVVAQVWDTFTSEFAHLWATERTGMLYPAALFEDQGHPSAAARDALLARIWTQALGFCGIEMHRRCLSLAHNADFEDIADTALRARLETRNVMLGRDLILGADAIATPAALIALARDHNERDHP